jgi:hypothetical protein
LDVPEIFQVIGEELKVQNFCGRSNKTIRNGNPMAEPVRIKKLHSLQGDFIIDQGYVKPIQVFLYFGFL